MIANPQDPSLAIVLRCRREAKLFALLALPRIVISLRPQLMSMVTINIYLIYFQRFVCTKARLAGLETALWLDWPP